MLLRQGASSSTYHRGNAPVTNIFPSTTKHSLIQTTENTRLPVGTQALSGLPMPLAISAKLLFVDIVRSSCPLKSRSMASQSRKPSTAQVARSPPAVATTKLNCWPCQTYRSLAMTGWAGIESLESQGAWLRNPRQVWGKAWDSGAKMRVSDGNGES
ncbi:hypothetical protein EV363DRAFT_1344902 [Boletus edulis]|nr:hypothetical protein EV363DRAFT_1344902 [Boletus edulis]